MFDLPQNLIVNNTAYPIRNKGDYRMVLDCFAALGDEELSETDRIFTCMVIFLDGATDTKSVCEMFDNDPELIQAAINEIFKFMNCGETKGVGATTNYKLVDWEQDAQIIASAINNVARCEVRALEYLHWWTFMGYYLSIGESAFSTIVGIRNKIKRGKKLEKYEQDFKRENPQYFVWKSSNVEEIQTTNALRDLWEQNDTR